MQWWPVGIDKANRHSNLSSYYFGRHPANSIELSRGWDFFIDPGPVTGPILHTLCLRSVENRQIPKSSFRLIERLSATDFDASPMTKSEQRKARPF
ncbi:MAG: hypothetical protein GY777_02600 [Candidatus Brocadiaceae bacterium]|nr:hypothetical protein [Candidatus Brocadiaceae bacterium]